MCGADRSWCAAVHRGVSAGDRMEHELGPNGTAIEGPWDEVIPCVRACMTQCTPMGAPRVYTTMKLNTRTDRTRPSRTRWPALNEHCRDEFCRCSVHSLASMSAVCSDRQRGESSLESCSACSSTTSRGASSRAASGHHLWPRSVLSSPRPVADHPLTCERLRRTPTPTGTTHRSRISATAGSPSREWICTRDVAGNKPEADQAA